MKSTFAGSRCTCSSSASAYTNRQCQALRRPRSAWPAPSRRPQYRCGLACASQRYNGARGIARKLEPPLLRRLYSLCVRDPPRTRLPWRLFSRLRPGKNIVGSRLPSVSGAIGGVNARRRSRQACFYRCFGVLCGFADRSQFSIRHADRSGTSRHFAGTGVGSAWR